MKIELETALKPVKDNIDYLEFKLYELRKKLKRSKDKDLNHKPKAIEKSLATKLIEDMLLGDYSSLRTLQHLLGDMKKLGEVQEVITPRGPEEIYNNNEPWTGD